jgi:hypothetical protein
MFEFIVSNFWGAVHLMVFVHGKGLLVDGMFQIEGFVHGNGFWVDKMFELKGFLHGNGLSVDGFS